MKRNKLDFVSEPQSFEEFGVINQVLSVNLSFFFINLVSAILLGYMILRIYQSWLEVEYKLLLHTGRLENYLRSGINCGLD